MNARTQQKNSSRYIELSITQLNDLAQLVKATPNHKPESEYGRMKHEDSTDDQEQSNDNEENDVADDQTLKNVTGGLQAGLIADPDPDPLTSP